MGLETTLPTVMQPGTMVYFSLIPALIFLARFIKRALVLNIPDEKDVLQHGYQKNRKTWTMQTSEYPLHILPADSLTALRTERKLDLPSHVHDQYQTKYTGAMCNSAFMRSVQVDLNKHMGEMLPDVIREMVYAFDRELPNSAGFTTIPTFEKTLRIIALVSGMVNVGPKISRQEEWLDLYAAYPINFFAAISAITKWPSYLRPLIQYTVPQLRQVRKIRARMAEILFPEFEARRNTKPKQGSRSNIRTMIQWVWDNSAEQDQNDETQSLVQILATVPTTYTVSFAVTQCIFDLAIRPEYIPILREEWESIVADSDSGLEGLTKELFNRMTKLDSFMKESQRLTPLALVSFERKALEPITLPDGTHIPKGAHVAAPSYNIGRDPKYFPDPERFDGLRFHHLQEKENDGKPPTGNSKYQYASVNETSLHFGYGHQACPGRWFAAIEIKLFLGLLLQRYDIALGDVAQGRPTSDIDRFFIYPDPTKMILLRKREVS